MAPVTIEPGADLLARALPLVAPRPYGRAVLDCVSEDGPVPVLRLSIYSFDGLLTARCWHDVPGFLPDARDPRAPGYVRAWALVARAALENPGVQSPEDLMPSPHPLAAPGLGYIDALLQAQSLGRWLPKPEVTVS